MAEVQKQRPGTRSFSLKLLLSVIAVACFVLVQFFPRVYVEVLVESRDGQASAQLLKSYLGYVTSDQALREAVRDSHLILESVRDDPVRWAKRRLQIQARDTHTVAIRAAGRPRERQRLKALADTLATNALVQLEETICGHQLDIVDAIQVARQRTVDDLSAQIDDQQRKAYEKRLQDLDVGLHQTLELVDQRRRSMPRITSRDSGWLLGK